MRQAGPTRRQTTAADAAPNRRPTIAARPLRALRPPWLPMLALLVAFPGAAAPGGSIYACVDASGKRLTADRPIAECGNREQRQLNADGSVRTVLEPTMTANERAEAEAAARRAALERAARLDALRRDRNLMIRFPNEAVHQRAREAALATLRQSVHASEKRIGELARERKTLLDEAEFYRGKTPPAKLQHALEANNAGVEAQRALMQNQQAETLRINALFDAELQRLRRLWGGVRPGSMGALPAAAPVSEPSHEAARP
jgi:hypothetical protein